MEEGKKWGMSEPDCRQPLTNCSSQRQAQAAPTCRKDNSGSSWAASQQGEVGRKLGFKSSGAKGKQADSRMSVGICEHPPAGRRGTAHYVMHYKPATLPGTRCHAPEPPAG